MLVSAITMACASLLAADEIKVEVLDWSGGACLGNFTEFFADEGAPITIPISSCVRRINVYSAPGVAPPFPDIGRITITGTTSNDFEVVISSSALNTSLTSTYFRSRERLGRIVRPAVRRRGAREARRRHQGGSHGLHRDRSNLPI